MIDKHKDYNQPSELVDEPEPLFFSCIGQFPPLTVNLTLYKIEFRKPDKKSSGSANLAAANVLEIKFFLVYATLKIQVEGFKF